jgi:hypothetical protein
MLDSTAEIFGVSLQVLQRMAWPNGALLRLGYPLSSILAARKGINNEADELA